MSTTTNGSSATTGDLRLRLVLGAVGVLVGAYGAYLLLRLGWDNLLATVYWLVGGVILHDFVIGFALIALGAAVVLVPSRVRAPVAAGLIVLGTVTMTAIPMLGRFGAEPYKPTLLDRNYTVGWLVFAVLVAIATGLGVLRATRRTAADTDGDTYGDTTREPHDERPTRDGD